MAVMSKKPENLFVNEYLTKERAALLFKLRTQKRANNSFERMYAWNGRVCAEIKSSYKVSFIKPEFDPVKFEQSLSAINA